MLGIAAAGAWLGSSNRLDAVPLSQETVHAAEVPFRPLTYFNTNCARCHGDYGSFYGRDFGKNLTEADLKRVIQEMAEGPAQAPLSDGEVEMLSRFHMALRDEEPFVHVVERTATHVSGEVLPGSVVKLVRGEVRTDVAVDGHAFRADGETSGATLEVSRNGKVQRLPLDEK